jgi:hypothetical protein
LDEGIEEYLKDFGDSVTSTEEVRGRVVRKIVLEGNLL